MSMVFVYRETLRQLAGWDRYLLENSSLPGPRGNLELLQAVVEEGDEACFRHLLTYDPSVAPTNTPEEFLAACGAAGLGKLMAAGQTGVLEDLRVLFSSRPAVGGYVKAWPWPCSISATTTCRNCSTRWPSGAAATCGKRAVVAALCEPRLLRIPAQVQRVLSILDQITAGLAAQTVARRKHFASCAGRWVMAGASPSWRCPPKARRSWKNGAAAQTPIFAGSCAKTSKKPASSASTKIGSPAGEAWFERATPKELTPRLVASRAFMLTPFYSISFPLADDLPVCECEHMVICTTVRKVGILLRLPHCTSRQHHHRSHR